MEGLLVLLLLTVLAVPLLLIWSLVSVSRLKSRVEVLEQHLRTLASAGAGPSRPSPPTEAAPPPRTMPAAATTPTSASVSSASPPAAASPEPGNPFLAEAMGTASSPPAATSGTAPQPPPLPRPRQAAPMPAPPQGPDAAEKLRRAITGWFTTGNVPVKVGMVVLLAGVAALLKLASDQGWLRVPIELRLLGVSLAALGGVLFGWRQRVAKPAFAQALQGGGIGVLLLTIFAATRMYGLVPTPSAFGLSVALVAGLGVLAVLQDSRTLAVLGVLAGFLAPIWLSDGGGNHVVLFTYYALLNLAIFLVAWVRPWRVLVLLGFAFTWGIGLLWGVLSYRPELYASTQPFLLLFFALYLLLPVLQARKRAPATRDRINGALLFGTPLIAFALQAGLLPGQPMRLAYFAVAAAVVYLVLAWSLRGRDRYALLSQAHAVLAVGFATLAVPLALSAQVTGMVFALEGAGLVWLAQRQGRRLPLVAGLVLQPLAALAFGNALIEAHVSGRLSQASADGRTILGIGLDATDASVAFAPVLNGWFMGGMLLALSALAIAALLQRTRWRPFAGLAYVWGLAWWTATWAMEVGRHAIPTAQPDWMLVVAALTGWLAAEARRFRDERLLGITVVLAFASALPLMLWQSAAHSQPFAGQGGVAWALFALLGVRSLMCLRGGSDATAPLAQFLWWLLWPTLLSLFAVWLGNDLHLASGWKAAMVALPWLALAALSQARPDWLAKPLGERFAGWMPRLEATVFALIALGWLASLFMASSAAPLPWLPLLNPLELMQAAALLLALWWLRRSGAHVRMGSQAGVVVGIAALAWITQATLRACHHWGGVPWGDALFSTALAQTSLTVLWSVLGVVGWIVGSRRGLRTLWLAGAVLMAVVLAKLVLVDRQHLGNLLGIGSFIAYGLLCTVVGWAAPAPPKHREEPSP